MKDIMEDDIDIENAWKFNLMKSTIWIWKQQLDLTTKGSLINLQSILFSPVLQCTSLLDTFCWNPPHPNCIFSQKSTSACLRDVHSSPRSSPVPPATPLPDVIITALFPSELPRRTTQIWQACNNPRCPHQIAELSSHSVQSVQN